MTVGQRAAAGGGAADAENCTTHAGPEHNRVASPADHGSGCGEGCRIQRCGADVRDWAESAGRKNGRPGIRPVKVADLHRDRPRCSGGETQTYRDLRQITGNASAECLPSPRCRTQVVRGRQSCGRANLVSRLTTEVCEFHVARARGDFRIGPRPGREVAEVRVGKAPAGAIRGKGKVLDGRHAVTDDHPVEGGCCVTGRTCRHRIGSSVKGGNLIESASVGCCRQGARKNYKVAYRRSAGHHGSLERSECTPGCTVNDRSRGARVARHGREWSTGAIVCRANKIIVSGAGDAGGVDVAGRS